MSRPRFVLKAAITLDGRICDAYGQSQWITGPEARGIGHELRSRCDATMVGAGTLLADDPSLNTRLEGGVATRPVLLDSTLRCPSDARVLRAGLRPWIFTGPSAPARVLPADIIRVPLQDNGLDIHAVAAELAARGVRHVLVEGGGRLHRTLFEADLVDELHVFIAPKVLAQGAGWLGGPGIPLAEAPQLRIESVTTVGPDLYLVLCRDLVTDSGRGVRTKR